MVQGGAAEVIGRARAAASAGDWQQAFALFMDADAGGLLTPADLPTLSEVAYAAGHLDVTITAWERVYAVCSDSGDAVGAAGAAARVAMHLLFDTALLAPVRGWLARAERLLEGQPPSAAHAWHAVVRAYERLLAGDLDTARPWAERAVALGSSVDAAACAIGRVAVARLLILDGEVDEGLALLDEVGVATVSGDLDPLSTGVVYCELVCALQGLAQYDLAEQWTEAMERWCRTNAIGSLHGRCRVHRAEILRLRGRYDEAEAEAEAACDELRPYLRRELGWPLSELGNIRLCRGDVPGAADALEAAHHAGWDPQPGLAMVQLAGADVGAAAASIRDALEHPQRVPSKERPPDHGLQRAPLLTAQVEIEVAAGDVERARAAVDELALIAERFRSKALVAGAALARGRLRLAEGEVADAEREFSTAARLWTDVGAPFEVAAARAGLAGCREAAGSGAPSTAAVAPPARPPAGAATDEFSWDGDYWALRFGGTAAVVRDRKGMRHLARLLAEPGREFHVLDLVAMDGGAVTGIEQGDSGALLDDEAREAYRRRLREIDDDIDDATAAGDAGRAEQAVAEREFLVRELSRAFGLGGRQRRAGSASERARVAVTRAVRQAMTGIGANHPPLGAHLDAAIRTGTYCSYAPDAGTAPTWAVRHRGGRPD